MLPIREYLPGEEIRVRDPLNEREERKKMCIRDRVWAAADSSYLAVKLELEHRSRKDIYYFTAGGYGKYGTPLFQCGDHYFSGK